MPFIDPSELDAYTGILNNQTYEPPKEKPGFIAATGAAFKVDNTAAAIFNKDSRNLLAHKLNGSPITNTSYDPYSDPRVKDHLHDEQFSKNLRYLDNPSQVEDLISVKLRTDEANKILQETSGFNQFVGRGIANLADPLTFIPYAGVAGKIAKAGSMARGAAAMATVGTIDQGLREGILNSAGLHTDEETALNVVGAAVISGIFGGVIHGVNWDKARSQVIPFLRPQTALPNAPVNPPGHLPTTGNAGAAKVIPMTTYDDEALVDSFGPNIGWNPNLRVAQSQSYNARVLQQQLTTDNLLRQKNLRGIANESSAHNEIKLALDNDDLTTVRDLEQGFNDFRKETPGVSYTDFKDMVSRQIDQGDLPSPAVANTADKFRARYAKWKDDQVENGFEMGGAPKFTPDGRPIVPRSHPLTAEELTIRELKRDIDWANNQLAKVSSAEKAALTKQINDAETKITQLSKRVPERTDVVSPHDAGNYLHRVFNRYKIENNPRQFKKILTDYLVASKADADEIPHIVDEIFDRITKHDTGGSSSISREMARDLAAKGKPSHMHERTLHIETSKIMDFLETDIEKITRAYAKDMHEQIVFKKMFGGTDLDAQLAKVNEDYDELIAKHADGSKEIIALNKERKQVIEDIKTIRDEVLGKLKEDTHAGAWHLRQLRAASTIISLGGQVLSSIPDLARPIMELGFKNYGKALWNTINPLNKVFKAAAREDLEACAVGLESALGNHLTRLPELTDIAESAGRSKFEAGMNWSNQKFMQITGMTAWNKTMKSFAGTMFMDKIIRLTKDTSKMAKDDIAYFAKMGIDRTMYSRIADQFAKHGEEINGLNISNLKHWDDEVAAATFKSAVHKSSELVINTPHPGDIPTLMKKSPFVKTIMQFTSFAFASHMQTLLPALQNKNAAAFIGFGAMLMLGAVQNNLRQVINGRDPAKNPGELFLGAFDRVGGAGIGYEIFNRFGGSEILKIATGLEGDRRKSWNAAEKVGMGPGLGLIYGLTNATVDAARDAADPNKDVEWGKTGTAFANKLPLHNYMGVDWVKAVKRTYDDQKSFADELDKYKSHAGDQFDFSKLSN